MEREVMDQIMEKAQEVLEWSKSHPGSTLRELEERVQKAIDAIRTELMEAAVAQQGVGKCEEALKAAGRCAEYLKARYGVKRVIPFGSVVGDGPWHEGSDLDLAVEGLAPGHFYRALAELERMVPPWLPVDLVPLKEVSERVRKHILGGRKMPEDRYLALKIRIEGEIENIERVIEGARSYLAQAPSVVPEIEMRGLARNCWSRW